MVYNGIRDVEVLLLWAVLGYMEGRNGENTPHEIVAADSQANNTKLPKILDSRVMSEGRISQGGEVVQKFEVQ